MLNTLMTKNIKDYHSGKIPPPPILGKMPKCLTLSPAATVSTDIFDELTSNCNSLNLKKIRLYTVNFVHRRFHTKSRQSKVLVIGINQNLVCVNQLTFKTMAGLINEMTCDNFYVCRCRKGVGSSCGPPKLQEDAVCPEQTKFLGL